MTTPTTGDWLITSTPQDNRAQPFPLHARPFPPPHPFSEPPDGWPRPTPVLAVPAAATALRALETLDPTEQVNAPTLPNIPGASPHPHVRPPAWDLVLIIDTGASMAAWYDSINTFVENTYKLGHFSAVPVVRLHSQGFDPARSVFDTAELGRAGIEDPHTKKVILVVTDAVGPAWKEAPLREQLANWSQMHPLAVVHVQPHPHWNRSALTTRALNLRSTKLGGPNTTFEVQVPEDPSLETLVPVEPLPKNMVIIPVMELSKRWIEQWCRLLNSSKWVRQQAIVLSTDTAGESPSTTTDTDSEVHVPSPTYVPHPRQESPQPTAEERVVEFLEKALPDTSRLTVLLAAAPLNRHIMQLIADHLMPQTGPEHLAEILSSGLLQVIGTDDPGSAPFDQIVFDFLPGVRKHLLARQRDGSKDCFEVAQVIDKYLGSTVPAVEGLAERIRQLSPPDFVNINEQNLPFLEVERDIFQARIPRARADAVRRMSDNIDHFKRHAQSSAGA
ncbi:SAV_2336 N-terminal domain-related protein [Streptomyces sp. NPDC056628]|uniref:SAV_2336 N-terminal domain-related protein n=1 Tax=Streptomyces sp. NPDC056628 TaxID=3345882 RepID=UPI0036CC6850